MAGCGCGRNRISRGNRLKKARLKAQKALRKNKLSSKNNKPITNPDKKTLICKSCPYGAQTSREKKNGIFVCHKTNLLINNIVKNINFNCPTKRWN